MVALDLSLLDVVEDRLDGLQVFLAHQLADVLHMAASGLAGTNAVGLVDGAKQIVRQREAGALLWLHRDEALAQRLQLVHLPLELGLAGAVVGGKVILGHTGSLVKASG